MIHQADLPFYVLIQFSRGERFRHLQNLQGSRSHLSSNNIHTILPLPLRLLSLADPPLDLTYNGSQSHSIQLRSNTGEPVSEGVSLRPPAGPLPPKSWTLNSKKEAKGTAAWRAEALALVLSHRIDPLAAPWTSDSILPLTPRNPKFKTFIPRIPSLSLLCFQILLATCTMSEFQDEIVPYIPPHLRKNLIRFTAIHSPLSTAHLYVLWEPVGHADGEVIVVGPNAALKDNSFSRSHSSDIVIAEGLSKDWDWDWDTEEADRSLPLYSLVFLNTSISSSTFFSFPPTLTHLALINMSTPVPLHRLPYICPLIIILDVSYNAWLSANFVSNDRLREQQPPQDTPIVDLRRVDWSRLNHLKVLGFRGNYVPENFLECVNKGRWDEITVVL